jgi:Zn-dependent peptidase ImmA (M78 family)/DNA-binding XRE family transcriptional regulator
MFNPTRLSVARRRRGFTKSELARQIGVDIRSVTAYESGTHRPRKATRDRISRILGFPTEFFQADDIDVPEADTASFRSLKKMTATQRDMALSQGAIALELNGWLDRRFDLPSPSLPDLSREPSPESAAECLRRHWGIGELPIRNVLHLLESQGVRIFSLALDAREVDAFSLWKNTTPFIFLNTKKSSEHSRFDAAHELGHLVLHRHAAPQGQEAEREANAFASAFLMPRASVIANAPRYPSLPDLVKLKKIWTVSVAALNYRLHAVAMLSDWQYRTMCIEIAKKGYRMKEPDEAPRETSQVLPRIFAALHEERIGRSHIAKALRIPRSELEQLMFGLTMASLDGGRRGPTSPKKAALRLVN